ncbi:MAG: sulfotransferase [Oscillatoria sp. PMC 1051.18]|nr:sulfotransferase [Oscillatoria sp. PMC 1050.18]MEC5032451.1 sulfotransferase [Oscillatoria sp. PMC 1051.18]
MKNYSQFQQLDLRFDCERVRQEIAQFSNEDWREESVGKLTIVLVSVGGTINQDFAISGAVKLTKFGENLHYLKQVISALEVPVSRSRLVRLAAKTETAAYTEYNYHWFRHNCIYLAITGAVTLTVNQEKISLATGEAVISNNFQPYSLSNETEQDCLYLVVETKRLGDWELSIGNWESHSPQQVAVPPLQERRESAAASDEISLETASFEVLTPSEIAKLTEVIFAEVEIGEKTFLSQILDEFQRRWSKVFAQFGHSRQGELAYQDLILTFQEQIVPKVNLGLRNSWRGKNAVKVILSMLKTSESKAPKKFKTGVLARKKLQIKPQIQWDACYQVVANVAQEKTFQRLQKSPEYEQILDLFRENATIAEVWRKKVSETEINREKFVKIVQKLTDLELVVEEFQPPKFVKPIFIVSAPRAGSTLLFETLSQFPELWTIGGESHDLIEGIRELHPSTHNYTSNRLTEADARPEICETLQKRFVRQLRDRTQQAYLDLPLQERPPKVRFLEKTPKNVLRIPFLKAAFPEALFIYLYRDPRQNISSLLDGWRSRRFVSYRNLPGWDYQEWSFFLPPNWSSLQTSSIVEIAAYQWKTANSYILDDLNNLPRSSWCWVRYSDLVQQPKQTITKISNFAELNRDEHIEKILSQSLPVSRMALSAPSPEKWRKNAQEIEPILPNLEPIIKLVEKENESSFA